MEKVRAAYLQFVQRVPFYGLAVLCIDNVNVRALLPHVNKRFVTYGTSPDADWQARELQVDGLETVFEVWRAGERLGAVRLHMPGRHHALNALAAIAVADDLGIPWRLAAHALEEFGGVHRRFEVRGEERGILVVDDYGHHPEEIRATLRAAREGFARRLVVAFQPHRFSRTRDLFDDFLAAFDDADVLLLTEIYPAGETPIPGVTRRGALPGARAARPSRRALGAGTRPPGRRAARDRSSGRSRASRSAPATSRAPADELLARLRTGAAHPAAALSMPRRSTSSTSAWSGPRRAGAGGASRSPAIPRTASAARPTCWRVPTRRRSWRCLLREARAAGVPVTLLGGGSNMLVGDGGIRGRGREARARLPPRRVEAGRRPTPAPRSSSASSRATSVGARARGAGARRGHPGHGGRRALHERRRLWR